MLMSLSIVNSNIYYEQSIIIGATAQVKLLSYFIFFLTLFYLNKTNISLNKLLNTFKVLAFLSITIYLTVFLAIDPQIYWSPESFLVKYSAAKGYYFSFPMTFIIIILFLYNRAYINTRKMKDLFVLLFILFVTLLIYKQRMAMSFILLSIILVWVFSLSVKHRLLTLLGLMPIFIFLFFYFVLVGDGYFSLNNPSFIIRFSTISTIVSLINENPLIILFGSGNLSPLNNITYNDLYGVNFWISDVGLIGLIFEFGIFGYIMMLGLLYIYYKLIKNIGKQEHIFIQTLKDLFILFIVQLPMNVSLAYSPGNLMIYLAVLMYHKKRFKI